jgi:hypothetical protein
MHLIHRMRRLSTAAPLILTLLFAACTSTATITVTGGNSPGPAGTTTPHPIPPATQPPAPPHAFAWTQYDSKHTPQLWASVNGDSPRQITHLTPITDGCDTQIAWSPPVFSPDLKHIAASVGSFNCGDGDMTGPISIVNVSNGAVSTVPGNTNFVRTNARTAGWLNNSTIFFVDASGLHTYTIGAGSPTAVPGLTSPDEAVLRGDTLFWTRVTFASFNWTTTLRRFSMSAHSALPGIISLGQVHACACSPGDVRYQGWDAAPDGAHVVYQVTTPKTGSSLGIASSKVYYANADGSSAQQIATYMTDNTNTTVRMQISPNGQYVAFTSAQPSPTVITAGVNSPGKKGDPAFHAYATDAVAFPVWKWDSTQFWAATKEDDQGDSGGVGRLQNYSLGDGDRSGVAGGYNPWYTIGG